MYVVLWAAGKVHLVREQAFYALNLAISFGSALSIAVCCQQIQRI